MRSARISPARRRALVGASTGGASGSTGVPAVKRRALRTRVGRAQSNGVAGFGFVGPALVLLAVLYVIPTIVDGAFSLTNYQLGGQAGFVGVANYTALAHDSLFGQSALNTLIFAVLTVGVGTALALGAALLLSGSFVGKGIYRFLIYLPQSISFASGAVIWTWLFNAQDGPINTVLRDLGGSGLNWLTSPHLALFSLVIMSWWRDIGFYMVVLIAAIEGVPQYLYEAARVDGASAWRTLWHVTLPSIRPAMLFVVLTWGLGALQMFTQTYIMTDGGPVQSTYSVVLKIYTDAFQSLHLGYAASEAFVLLFVSIIIGAIAVRWFSRDLERV